jgi:hypothetical protein
MKGFEMGNDASATICLGIAIENGFEFPWQGDIDEWWIKEVCKYVPPFEIYTKDGNFINGKRPDEKVIEEYYDHKNKFEKEHPLPVTIVRNGAGDYDSGIILAVNNTVQSNDWDTPVDIKELNKFWKFCKQYLDMDVEPKWLSAYYG